MYSYDNELAEKVAKVITEDELFEELSGCRISVLYCDKAKKSRGRTVFADTRKLNEMASFMTGYDFVITFYADVEYLSETALEILIRHELRHVGYETRGGNVVKKLVPHDVEDFRGIVDEYGLDWPMLQDNAPSARADS